MSRRRYQQTGLATTDPGPNHLKDVEPQVAVVAPSEVGQEEKISPWQNPQISATPNKTYRMTTSLFPSTKELQTRLGVPFFMTYTPGAVSNSVVIDGRASNIIRCARCGAFASPYTKVEGDRVLCPFCPEKTQIQAGCANIRERPEVLNASYDVLPGKMMGVGDRKLPAFFFLVDVSRTSFAAGLPAVFLESLKATLPSMNSTAVVYFATMSDRLTLYDLAKGTVTVIADLADMAIVAPTLITLGKAKERLLNVIDEVLRNEKPSSATGNCLGSAYRLVEMVMGRTGGILSVCSAGIPKYGPMALREREVLPETTEAAVLGYPPDQPAAVMYRESAIRMNKVGISTHLYAVSVGGALEAQVTGIPAGLSCGVIRLYTTETVHELHSALFAALTTDYLWGAYLQVKVSAGVNVTHRYGNIVLLAKSNTASFPVLNPRVGMGIELAVDKGGLTANEVIVQTALMFKDARRRAVYRVFTMVIPVSSDLNAIVGTVDEMAVMASMQCDATRGVLSMGSKATRVKLLRAASKMLVGVRRPPSFYHLTHAIAESPMLTPWQLVGADRRMCDLIASRAMRPIDTLLCIYPRMFALDTANGPLPLATESYGLGSAFLFHTNQKIVIWVGSMVDQAYLRNAFGVSTIQELPAEVPTIETQENTSIRNRVSECWELCSRYLPVEILGEGDPRESEMASLMVDTRPSFPRASLSHWIAELTGQVL